MHKFRPITSLRLTRFCLAVGTLSGVAALGLGGQSAWADTSCTPPSNGPTGPSASTFTYQCSGTYTGDWTNSYYAYDPTTGTQTALYSPDYSYDCATNTWTKAEWDYDAGSGAYVESRVATTAPPNQPTNCATTGASNSSNSTTSSGAAASTTGPVPDTAAPNSSAVVTPAVATAPPDPNTVCPIPSNNPSESPSDSTTSNGVNLNNNVCSQSKSGNANVTDNHHAGDATSGNATTEENVANLVNSSSSATGTGTVVFTSDVNGNVNGDLVLDPSTLNANAAGSDPGNAVATVNTDASINNTITATAVSGDATVSGNGTGGSATTGNAETIVNLINMINSAIASGQSFVGTINIYGDLNGNILIPQSVIDQLLASNAAGNSGSSLTGLNNNESITNNVNASAISGDAAVTGNDIGGNATTGKAGTNVTIMNLTGSSIVGKNVLLVFVNVLGQWIGMILNAPAGATSAEFGGGIANDTPGTGNSVVEANTNLGITNNVNASATSGDATVSNNWVGGNATSGKAGTAVNILNVENSTLSLANWFGILFINVFGTWNGNFGIQSPPAPTANPSDTTVIPSIDPVSQTAQETTHHNFASFIPHYSNPTSTAVNTASAVLGDAASTPVTHTIGSTLPASNDSHTNFILPLIGLCVALALLAGAERDRLLNRTKHND